MTDFKRYRLAAGLTQEEAAEVMGYRSRLTGKKMDDGIKMPSKAEWLIFLKFCQKRMVQNIKDIETEIESAEREVFGD